jgi:hypothetical protein
MPLSQNLLFEANSPADPEFEHPAGAALMRTLSTDLGSNGWNVDEMDNWRDSGWSVTCQRGQAKVEVVLCRIPDGTWMLQIAPTDVPGSIGRFLGRKQSATADEIQELAVRVHRALSDRSIMSKPRWTWDGYPDDQPSTPEPTAP